jgi:CoA:oxalate CoA-transferase
VETVSSDGARAADAFDLPLSGYVVFDFTRHLSGPFASMILRDLGARVVKFEPPAGDPSRRSGPFDGDDSAYFHTINRAKESVVIDFHDPHQIGSVLDLMAAADCVIENFRPGVMAAMGLGPDQVLGRWPGIVYASLSGFGSDGPYAERPAYDVVVQAMGGVMSVTGHAEGPPTRVGVSQGDILAGVYAALAVLAALVRRGARGIGSYIDVSMLEAQLHLATHAFGIRSATGSDPRRIGNRHPAVAPFDVYPTSGGFVAIAVVDDAAFGRLCGVLGLPELATDDRFSSRESRLQYVTDLTHIVSTRTAEWRSEDLVAALTAASVAAGPVATIGDLMDDEHLSERGSLLRVPDWGSSGLAVPRPPFRLDGQRLGVNRRAPDLGSLTLDQLKASLERG